MLQVGRFVVKVYGPPREHPPAHAHVEVGRAGVVVVRLGLGADKPVTLWSVKPAKGQRITLEEATQAVRLVERNERRIRTAWERLHG